MTDTNSFGAVSVRRVDTKSYEFGGLRLSSSLDLPLLAALPAAAPNSDVDIHIGVSRSALPDGPLVHQSSGRFGLALHRLGSGWVFRHRDIGVVVDAEGLRLVCHCPRPSDGLLLAEILVRRILPKLCYRHGRLPLHAATLANGAGGQGARAAMLLGTSGSGKSTLTAALARYRGWRIFGDDMSILDDRRHPAVLGGVAGVSLWQDAVDGLDIASDEIVSLAGYEGKYAYRPGAGPSAALPLTAIILLSVATDADVIRLERLEGPEVLVMLCSQIVPFNPRDVAESGDLMRRLGQVTRDVPVFALAYPRRYAKLSAVADAIATLVDGPAS